MDDLEIKYISELNTITPNGYNNTSGGKGTIGYNYTKVVTNKISESMKKFVVSGVYTVYCYNINTEEINEFPNLTILNEKLNLHLNNGQLRNLVINKLYILARSKEDLNNKITKYKNRLLNLKTNTGQFQLKITEEMKTDILNEMSLKEFINKYNVCKKTYINYKHQLIPNYKRDYGVKYNRKEFHEYIKNHDKYSIIAHFNLTESQYLQGRKYDRSHFDMLESMKIYTPN